MCLKKKYLFSIVPYVFPLEIKSSDHIYKISCVQVDVTLEGKVIHSYQQYVDVTQVEEYLVSFHNIANSFIEHYEIKD